MRIPTIALILFITTTSPANTGCLSYSTNTSQCLICDNQNNYYKVGDSCTQKTISNCEYTTDGEMCLQCNQNYYVVYATNMCAAVTIKVSNCQYYADDGQCSTCTGGYYLTNNTCVQVTTTISNCEYYSADGVCSQCKDGYYTNNEDTACLTETFANCMNIGIIQCDECSAGSLSYDNAYLYYFNIWSTNIIKNIDIYAMQDQYFTTCVPYSVNNCLEYSEFDQCTTCEDGYFVDSTYQCELIPDQPIANCFEYQTVGVCTQCLDGYYLVSSSDCEPHTATINFCLTMSMTQKNVCDECVNGYYLDAGSCVARTLTVNGCSTYSVTQDICAECQSVYYINQGGTQCFTKYANCMTFSATVETLTCTQCNTGYYWVSSTSACTQVTNTLDGCAYYESYTNASAGQNPYICSQCTNGYYMSNGTCLANDTYVSSNLSCNQFSSTAKDVCKTCADDTMTTFSVINYCTAVPLANVDNYCLYYTTTPINSTSESVVCGTCKPEYYLVNSQYCVAISIASCEEVSDSTTCITCSSTTLENYFPNKNTSNNTCIQTYDFVTNNCTDFTDVKVVEGTNYNICSNCYSPYYPEVFDGASFCVPKNQIVNNYTDGTTSTTTTLNNKLASCVLYAPEAANCLQCEFDTVNNLQMVINNGVCADSCTSPSVPILEQNSQFFLCVSTITVENCSLLSNTNKCLQCANMYPPMIYSGFAFNYPVITYDYLPQQQTQHFEAKSLSYDSEFNYITTYDTCYQPATSERMNFIAAVDNALTYKDSSGNTQNQYPVTLTDTDWSSTSNYWNYCKAMYRFGSSPSYYGCVMCQFGFTGYYVQSSQTYQYIPTCSLSTDCSYGVFYMGIGSQLSTSELDFWVGCHQCLDTTKIPTFSRFGRAGYVTSGQPSATTTAYFTQTSCQTPGIITNSLFPSNCAIQEYAPTENIQIYVSNISQTTPNPRCVACAPGYKATVVNGFMQTCTAISNCDSEAGMTTFNKCMQCNTGYVINSTRDQCYQNSVANCYEAYMDSGTNNPNRCLVCIQGYIPTRDYAYCNQVNLDNCLSQDFFELSSSTSTAYTGSGCLECDLGYVATQFAVTQQVCVYSPQIYNRIYTSVGITNCKTYSGPQACSSCNVGFILPEGVTDSCISASTVPNCSTYNSDQTCKDCNSGYILLNGNCEDGSKYITNCQTFSSTTVCSQCADSYVPITSNGKTRCYYVGSSILNCLNFEVVTQTVTNANGSTSSQIAIKCDTCKSGYYPATIYTSGVNTCVYLPSITGCTAYDSTTGECTQCSDSYYLEAPAEDGQLYTCVARTAATTNLNIYANCSVKNPTADVCETCSSGYYVRNGVCAYKPTGVIGCAVYQNSTTCLKCQTGQYLTANVCRIIPTENYITNCLYYSDATTCSDCDEGYLLEANSCNAILISNCEIYNSVSSCQVCTSQYFLTAQNTCSAGSISNCQLYATLTQCSVCNSGYYPASTGQCAAIDSTNSIPSCKYYNADLTCMQCQTSMILSADKKSCGSFADFPVTDSRSTMAQSNCDNYSYNTYCKICNAGYMFVDGTCQSCSQTLSNCFFCDYSNDSVCHVCKPGYYMDTNGACQLDQSVNLDDDEYANYIPPSFELALEVSKFIVAIVIMGISN